MAFRLLSDDIATILGLHTPKTWRPDVPDDDGDHFALPCLSADSDGEDFSDAVQMLSDDIAEGEGLHVPKAQRPAGVPDDDGGCGDLFLPLLPADGGGEDLLNAGGVLSDDVAMVAGLPKRQRPAGAPDDGCDLFLPLLSADGDEEDVLDEDSTLSTEEEGDDPTPHPWWLPPGLQLDMGSAYVAKEGVHPLGEDGHFLSQATNAFGIADGLGGWTRRGVDVGEFAWQLMCFCEAELEEPPTGCRAAAARLKGVLERALARTTARGSSTALIAAVDGRLLRAVTVGDSGFLVLRGGQVVYHSPTHQRQFDRPYQVGGLDQRDPPQCAKSLEVEIEPGDLIVAGTSNLFGNLFDEEVQDVVARAQEDGHGTPDDIAHAVACAAVDAYQGEKATPFTVARWEAGLPRGGPRPDDVTVVVARVR